MTHIICGVDVSSTSLDVALRLANGSKAATARFANDAEGIAGLIAFCRQHHAGLVVMEATGGYERLALGHLWEAKLPVAIANPRMVRRFAEAMGLIEKTDRIDAALIAHFAATKHLRPIPPSSKNGAELAALVTRLRQLTDARTAQLNQRRLVTSKPVSDSFAAVIATLNAEIRRLEGLVASLISADPLWAKLDATFRTIKGVADRTTARLMAELPEIGTLSGKAVAKLAGLAPIANDSGNSSGKRSIRGGRASVRSILFVVAEIVRRHNKDFQDFHNRLAKAGKPKLVIRVALARKLLTRLNAKARDARAELNNTSQANKPKANKSKTKAAAA